MNDGFIPIGKIAKTHGLNGELKVFILSDIPERLKSVSSVYLVDEAKSENLTISSCRINKNCAIIKFKDMNSISSIRKLIGNTIYIKQEELLDLPDDSYYIHSLIGLEVYDEMRNHMGRLKEVWKLPANDVFVVQEGTKETLFPVVKEAIKSISTEKREIVVDRSFGVA